MDQRVPYTTAREAAEAELAAEQWRALVEVEKQKLLRRRRPFLERLADWLYNFPKD